MIARIGIISILSFFALLTAHFISTEVKEVTSSSYQQVVVVDPYYQHTGLHQNMPRLTYQNYLRDQVSRLPDGSPSVVTLGKEITSEDKASSIYTVNQQEVKALDII